MTPYKIGRKVVIIEPLKDLTFGKLPKKYNHQIGIIEESKYCAVKKYMTYGVRFTISEELLWFKESEIF